VLHLSEHDELDDDADKRDAGRWLHATLEHFHRHRQAPVTARDDVARLLEAGRETLALLSREAGVSEESMLPFTAGFPQLADRYLRWLHKEEAQGWVFEAAELAVDSAQQGDTALRIHGRIDRIDMRAGGADVRLIDYKTGSRKSLLDKVRQPLEDTQLAVYAALQLQRSGGAGNLQACYLALDDPEQVVAVAHPAVTESARRLVLELRAERERIDNGAALPALGEGRVCETCEARGLCRRDHWDAEQEESSGAA
jgi:ATP-dependent helicase/nuclease subunit B